MILYRGTFGVVFGSFLVVLLFFLYLQKDNSEMILNEIIVTEHTTTSRQLRESDSINLPLSGSTPQMNTKHTIPIEEIRQGCFRQDCIPSIDEPEFIDVATAVKLLPQGSIGIALSYKNVDRFYPFPMLETHELVNDIVAGDPLLISYCPLCGTGIVFDRRFGDKAVQFGVSGMLWQSNLLMYNRAENIQDRNLWSQVLGEAVVGNNAGQKLSIIPSDVMLFEEWSAAYPNGKILAGTPQDPYNGNYFQVAERFAPSFNAKESSLQPDEYVYGIVVDDLYKAYPAAALPEGTTTDMIADGKITIQNMHGRVSFTHEDGTPITDIEGFWFSWKAAHPDTLIWN